MKKVKNKNKILNNKKGQGMVEYILLLVIVIGLVFSFKKPIGDAFNKAMGKADAGINDVIQ